MKNQSTYIIDLNGFMASVAALQAVQKFREMKMGECLEMVNCNHETMRMIFRFFPRSAYQLRDEEKMSVQSCLYRIMMRENGVSPDNILLPFLRNFPIETNPLFLS